MPLPPSGRLALSLLLGLLLASCRPAVDGYNTLGLQQDLGRLLAVHAPALSLTRCALLDPDPLAPTGTCVAMASAAQRRALVRGLGLSRDAAPPAAAAIPPGCRAHLRGSSPAEAFRAAAEGRTGPFSDLRLYVQAASGRLCFVVRYGWG